MFNPERLKVETAPLSEESSPNVPIEQQANFKGNYSELLFSRMHNPVIRDQLLDTLEANEKWIAEHPPNQSQLKKDPETGEVLLDDLGLPIFISNSGVYVPKTREQLDNEIEEGLLREQVFTSVDFTKPLEESVNSIIDTEKESESPTNRTAVVGLKREDNTPLSENEVRTMSMVESHEKGHIFRKFKPSQYLHNRFSQAFDLSQINADDWLSGGRPEGSSDKDIKDAIEGYFNLSDPHEFIERMSQLKGYFGMKGDEVFTPQHLEHAREYYLKDGMMDNNMKAFFQAITPQTEFAFLKLINSIGV